MFKSIGQAILQTLNFLLKNSTGKVILYNGLRLLAKKENQDRIRETTRETTQFVSERFKEFVTSIQLKINFREKEAQFIVDVSKKYYVGQAENSRILQGENISCQEVVNNYLIFINFNENSIHNLEETLKKLKLTERSVKAVIVKSQTSNNDKPQEDIDRLSEEIDLLSEIVKKSISKLTDYPTLQKALDTE